MHKHVGGFVLNPQSLRKQKTMLNPSIGEFSVLVLAATVAHHMDVVDPPKGWASAIADQPPWVLQSAETTRGEHLGSAKRLPLPGAFYSDGNVSARMLQKGSIENGKLPIKRSSGLRIEPLIYCFTFIGQHHWSGKRSHSCRADSVSLFFPELLKCFNVLTSSQNRLDSLAFKEFLLHHFAFSIFTSLLETHSFRGYGK